MNRPAARPVARHRTRPARRPARRAAALGVLLAAATLTACGGGSDGGTGSAVTAPASAGAAPAQPATVAPGTRLSANTATEAELMTIPGVGEKIAHEITEYRPYDATTGPAKFRDEMKKYVDDAEVERLLGYLDFS